MMTEDEAKTKWCPMGSAGVAALVATGRTEPVEGFVPKCIGSNCMMWRAVEKKFEEIMTDLGQLPPNYDTESGWQQIDNPGGWGLRYRRKVSDAGGYCGLAGKPE